MTIAITRPMMWSSPMRNLSDVRRRRRKLSRLVDLHAHQLSRLRHKGNNHDPASMDTTAVTHSSREQIHNRLDGAGRARESSQEMKCYTIRVDREIDHGLNGEFLHF